MDTIFDGMSRFPAALALDVAAKSTLILAASGAAALALRPASAATRHLAWCLGLWARARAAGPGALRAGLGLADPAGPRGRSLRRIACARVAPSIPVRSPEVSAVHAASPPLAAVGMIESSASGRSPSASKLREDITAAQSPVNSLDPRKFSPWTWLARTWSAVAVLILAVPLVGRIALRRLSRGRRRSRRANGPRSCAT